MRVGRRSALRVMVGVAAAIGAGAALGHGYERGGIAVVHPWSRETPPGAKVAVGYMSLRNGGKQEDRLVAVECATADRVEMHETRVEDGVARMRPVEGGIALPPGRDVVLGPDGLHLMFVGLKKPLAAYDDFAATLVFQKAGRLDVTFEVVPLGQTPHAH